MKKCKSCNINFNTKENLCPLCQNKLSGYCDDLIYTKNIKISTNILIMRIILFISISISIITSFIELYFSGTVNYNIYVYLGFLTNYCVINFILKNTRNILKMFIMYGLILIILTLIWYYVTKLSIITNYIIPVIAIFELIFNLVIGIILKKKYFVRYSNLIVMNVFLLLLPIILVCFGLTTNNLMSYICLALALITISGLLIFFFDDIKEELSKIFNI